MGLFNKNTLVFKKEGDTGWKDLRGNFDMVVIESPPAIPIEFKEVVSTDFSDEEGEDAYFPAKLYCKGVDWSVKVGALGDHEVMLGKIKTLVDYLRGATDGKTKLTIGNPWTCQQYSKCYIKSLSNIEYFKDANNEAYATLSITFRITDPSEIDILR